MNNPFIAFCKYTPDKNGNSNNYQVLLVNPTDKIYPKVLTYTGAFEEDVVAEPTGVNDLGELGAQKSILLEESNVMALDFTIWYKLTLIDSENNASECNFSIHKGEYRDYDDLEEDIELVGKKGMIIPLFE